VLPGLICNLLNIFCFENSFQKCVLQLLEFQAHQAKGDMGARAKPLDQNLSWMGGDVCAKFHQDQCRGLDFTGLALHIPTDIPTDRQTSERLYI